MYPCRSLATSGMYITREDSICSAIELHSYQVTQLIRIRDICTRRLLLTQGCRCRPLMSYVLLVSLVERRVKNRNPPPQALLGGGGFNVIFVKYYIFSVSGWVAIHMLYKVRILFEL